MEDPIHLVLCLQIDSKRQVQQQYKGDKYWKARTLRSRVFSSTVYIQATGIHQIESKMLRPFFYDLRVGLA